MLQTLLKDAARKNDWSSRDMAEAIGVSHTTILRALRGEIVDLETIIKIADWLEVRPADLLNSFGRKGQDTAANIAVLLERVPELAKPLAQAAQAIRNGEADPGLIEDIVAYATYKLSVAGGTNAAKSKARRRRS